MKKTICKLLAFIAIISAVLTACSAENKSRYMKLGDGNLPVILDTKTNEVYVIVPATDGAPIIYKKALSQFEK